MTGSVLRSSFRDPAGYVVSQGGHLFRLVRPEAVSELTEFLHSHACRKLLEEGQLVGSTVLDPQTCEPDLAAFLHDCLNRCGAGMVLEHERIFFPSFPYEWPPEMLYAAAELTLDLAEISLQEGFGLKDATPYNVLFRGTQPVFVDLLSLERRHPGDPTWRPYAQFIRTFLLPLALYKYYGLRLDQMLLSRRDGVEPEDAYRLLKFRHKILPPFLTLVSLPKWLGTAVRADDSTIYKQRILARQEKAQFILRSTFRGLRRSLRHSRPKPSGDSTWSGYMHGGNIYSSAQFNAKRDFVRQVLSDHKPERVLDVGCNTGYFSLLAAEMGASVVAIDQDPVVVGEVWRTAKSRNLDVLPLVVDLNRPTPAIGWQNEECPSFLDRAKERFDTVFMLAVVHHMIVTERVPLARIFDLAAKLTKDLLVIEFVGPGDPMFQRLLRGRDELHKGLTPEVFESSFLQHFEIVRCQIIEGTHRRLYLLRKTTPPSSG